MNAKTWKTMQKGIARALLFVMFFTAVQWYVPRMEAKAGSEFVKRNSPPDANSSYYDKNKNGYGGNSYPNCTAYAYGRLYEITGKKPNVSMNNANTWYEYNKSYPCSTDAYKPAIGAVVCCAGGAAGHVQIVEEIGKDSGGEYICVSESNWSANHNSSQYKSAKTESEREAYECKAFNYKKIYLSDLDKSKTSGKVYQYWLEDNDGIVDHEYYNGQDYVIDYAKRGSGWNWLFTFQGYIYAYEVPENLPPIEVSITFGELYAENITDTSAKIGTTVDYLTYDDFGFYYGTVNDINSMTKVSENKYGNVTSSTTTKYINYQLGVKYDGYGYKWAEPLKPGTTYYYAFYANYKGEEYKTAVKSFKTTGTAPLDPNVDTLYIKDVAYPINVLIDKDYGNFNVSGSVQSNANITNVNIGVKDSAGNVVFDAKKTPNVKDFSISSVDTDMKFRSIMTAGTYYYFIDAYDANGATLHWSRPFTKSSAATTSGKETAASSNPYGYLDEVVGGTGKIRVGGWAFDRDDLSKALQIKVVVGNSTYYVTAGNERADVNRDIPCIGDYHGFYSDIAVKETGSQKVSVYAVNIGGGSDYFLGDRTVTIVSPDSTKPQISDVVISDVSASGYTISCVATDNVGVTKVAFPTWTNYNGQDDLKSDWRNNALGTYSNGRWVYRVNTSEHNNEVGTYLTDIYAYDAAGNYGTALGKVIEISAPLTAFTLNTTSLDLSINEQRKLQVSSYTPSNTTSSKTATWSSSNSDIAKVDASGNVTAVAPGTAIISCTVAGIVRQCEVRVSKADINKYSDWMETLPSNVSFDAQVYHVEEKLQYRGRNKETTTSNSSTMSGWTLQSEAWGNWVESASLQTATATREVKTDSTFVKKQYKYSHWHSPSGSVTSPKETSGYTYHETGWLDAPLTYYADSSVGGAMYKGSGKYGACGWGSNWSNPVTQDVYSYKYYYRDKIFTFSRWSNWTDWTDTNLTGQYTSVETRTLYRYQKIQADDIILEQNVMELDCDNISGRTLTADCYGDISGKAVTWSSSNENVAKIRLEESDAVNQTIVMVEAVNPGTAVITAKWGSVTANCTVTVIASKAVTITIDSNGDKYYCIGGKPVQYTGLKENQGTWWYVTNGKINSTYTGLVNDEIVGWWYVENGAINFSKNGLVQNEYGWWCVYQGGVAFDYTGLWNDEKVGWWYVENGAINFWKDGLVQNEYGWWCVSDGRVAFEYTGLWNDETVGWWYVENGAINFIYSGFVPYSSLWWCVSDGRVALDYTGLWNDENAGWWYVKDGQVDFNYSGKVTYNGNQYQVVNGQRVS